MKEKLDLKLRKELKIKFFSILGLFSLGFIGRDLFNSKSQIVKYNKEGKLVSVSTNGKLETISYDKEGNFKQVKRQW